MVNRKCLLVVFLGIGLIFDWSAKMLASEFDAPGESIIQCVTTEELELDLKKGQICHLRFFLRCKAEISVSILDVYDYQVRQLVKNKTYDRGTVCLEWDGKDDQENFVSTGAYIPFITAQTEKKQRYIYDPRETTGWEGLVPMSKPKPVYDASKGYISFTLDKPGYVRLRIGSHDGLLYATLMDWEYRYKGSHQIPWNGKDPTGTFDLTKSYKSKGRCYRPVWLDMKETLDKTTSYVIIYEARSLPENATCIVDSPNSGVLSRERQGTRIEIDRERYLAQAKLNPSFVIVGRGLSPRFRVEFDGSSPKDGNIPVVSGACKLNVEIDKAEVGWLPNEHFDIILWIDDIYVDSTWGIEGHTSATWQIDTTKYFDGLHVVTAMIESSADRMGTQSFIVEVRNNK